MMRRTNIVLMKSCTTVLLFIAACISAYPQIAVTADPVGARPLTGESYLDVEGSPFLFSEWRKGAVTLEDGTTYSNLMLMYDQVSDQLIFKNTKGQTQIFLKPVKAFTIDGAPGDSLIFQTGYPPKQKAFYQVLVAGNTSLLKKETKVLMDEKEYGSARTVRHIVPSIGYFIVRNGQLKSVKLQRKSILAAFGDRHDDIERYIADRRLRLGEEASLVELALFYNTF